MHRKCAVHRSNFSRINRESINSCVALNSSLSRLVRVHFEFRSVCLPLNLCRPFSPMFSSARTTTKKTGISKRTKQDIITMLVKLQITIRIHVCLAEFCSFFFLPIFSALWRISFDAHHFRASPSLCNTRWTRNCVHRRTHKKSENHGMRRTITMQCAGFSDASTHQLQSTAWPLTQISDEPHWRNWVLIKMQSVFFPCIGWRIFISLGIGESSFVHTCSDRISSGAKKKAFGQTCTMWARTIVGCRRESWCHKHHNSTQLTQLNSVLFRFTHTELAVFIFFFLCLALNPLTAEQCVLRMAKVWSLCAIYIAPLINLNAMKFENRIVSCPKSIQNYFNWMIPQSSRQSISEQTSISHRTAKFLLTKLTRRACNVLVLLLLVQFSDFFFPFISCHFRYGDQLIAAQSKYCSD